MQIHSYLAEKIRDYAVGFDFAADYGNDCGVDPETGSVGARLGGLCCASDCVDPVDPARGSVDDHLDARFDYDCDTGLVQVIENDHRDPGNGDLLTAVEIVSGRFAV